MRMCTNWCFETVRMSSDPSSESLKLRLMRRGGCSEIDVAPEVARCESACTGAAARVAQPVSWQADPLPIRLRQGDARWRRIEEGFCRLVDELKKESDTCARDRGVDCRTGRRIAANPSSGHLLADDPVRNSIAQFNVSIQKDT